MEKILERSELITLLVITLRCNAKVQYKTYWWEMRGNFHSTVDWSILMAAALQLDKFNYSRPSRYDIVSNKDNCFSLFYSFCLAATWKKAAWKVCLVTSQRRFGVSKGRVDAVRVALCSMTNRRCVATLSGRQSADIRLIQVILSSGHMTAKSLKLLLEAI